MLVAGTSLLEPVAAKGQPQDVLSRHVDVFVAGGAVVTQTLLSLDRTRPCHDDAGNFVTFVEIRFDRYERGMRRRGVECQPHAVHFE
jgi:hypothetical protein